MLVHHLFRNHAPSLDTDVLLITFFGTKAHTPVLPQVSGLPTPDLLWQLNGQTIRPDSSHKMLVRENGVHSLVVEPVSSRDAGIYTCIASNRAGQNSFNLELIVAGTTILFILLITCFTAGQIHSIICRVLKHCSDKSVVSCGTFYDTALTLSSLKENSSMEKS